MAQMFRRLAWNVRNVQLQDWQQMYVLEKPQARLYATLQSAIYISEETDKTKYRYH